MDTYRTDRMEPVNRVRHLWPKPTEGTIRTDLVQHVRRQIAAGTYETAEKWEAAFDRLLDTLG